MAHKNYIVEEVKLYSYVKDGMDRGQRKGVINRSILQCYAAREFAAEM